MKKIILLIITVSIMALVSCTPKYAITYGFTKCGDEIEMTENSVISNDYVSLGWLFVAAKSGEYNPEEFKKDMVKKGKEPVSTNELYEVKPAFNPKYSKSNYRIASYEDLTEYANKVVKEIGGDAIINVKFDPVYKYHKGIGEYLLEYIKMDGEVIKKRNY